MLVDANEKYGFSKNAIYKCIEDSNKYSTSKCGLRLACKDMYSII